MKLLKNVKDKYKIISIVGMAKNSGKTVTLNSVLEEAEEENLTLGLTSIGRDGEKTDIVTKTEKPQIYAYEGTIIATARSFIENTDTKIEILEVTDCTSSMGKIVIGRVVTSGYIELAGAASGTDIIKTSNKMLEYGAKLVIVDGAIDRKSSASPSVTEATILASGAVLSRDINKAILQTVYQANLFNLKSINDDSIKEISKKNVDRNILVVDKNYNVKKLELLTALNTGNEIANSIDEDTFAVLIPGSIVTKTVEDIIQKNSNYKSVIFVVKDATKIFIDYVNYMKFEKKGFKIEVLNEINLIAITINPTAPEGYFFDSKDYADGIKSYLDDIDVMDVMQ